MQPREVAKAGAVTSHGRGVPAARVPAGTATAVGAGTGTTTVVLDWLDFHFDLNGAYLDSEIDAEVFVDQPAGLDPVVGPNGEKMCMAAARPLTLGRRDGPSSSLSH